MVSPFPGMDPYIETCDLWGDFHLNMIAAIQRSLAPMAPERYLVRAEERSYLTLMQDDGPARRAFRPDLRITASARRKQASKKGGATALAESAQGAGPKTMRALIVEENREAFVEIREAGGRRLVTCIELLSPSNKRPGTEGWELYLRKRHSLMLSGVHLVEIDLLRGGQRMPMLDPWPDTPYTVLVARAHQSDHCRVWPASFQSRLPVVPVPLLKPDADLSLDLQPIVDSIYSNSRYDRSVDYRKPLTPPLAAEDTTWLKRRLAARQSKASK